MAKILVLAISVLSLYIYFVSCEDNDTFANCDQDITVLERALYIPKNIQELKRVFYPPREPPSRFIKVTYKFDGHNCSVTYIWAIGGFLLMQPPKIFQLTSLYFSTSANNLTDLVIQLPSQCWPLVNINGTEDNCTCMSCDYNKLDILTQQVRENNVFSCLCSILILGSVSFLAHFQNTYCHSNS